MRIRVPKHPGRPFLAKLDALSFEKPKTAKRLASRALPRIEVRLLPDLLGIYGTACRRTIDLPKAQAAFKAGISMAQRLKDTVLEARLVKRFAYVPGENGEFHLALQLSAEAASLFDLCDDRASVGECLVDQGLWRFHLGRFDQSIQSLQRALTTPMTETRHRFTAIVGQAFNLQKLGRPHEALEFLQSSKPLAAQLGASFQGSFLSVSARLAEDFGEHTLALREYRAAAEHYFEAELFLEVALAEACRIKILTKRGAHGEACALAKNMGALIEHFDSKPAIGMVTELMRQAIAGDVTAVGDFVRELDKMVRAESPHLRKATF